MKNHNTHTLSKMVKNIGFYGFAIWAGFSLIQPASAAHTDEGLLRRTKDDASTSTKDILQSICGSPQFAIGNKAHVTLAVDAATNTVITQHCSEPDSEACQQEKLLVAEHKASRPQKSLAMQQVKQSQSINKKQFQANLAKEYNAIITQATGAEKPALQEFAKELLFYYDNVIANEAAQKEGIGNCGEHKASALVDYTKHKLNADPHLHIQSVTLSKQSENADDYSDHMFLLLNSNIQDVNTADAHSKHSIDAVMKVLKRGSTFLCDRWNVYMNDVRKDKTGYYQHKWQHVRIQTMRLIEVFRENYANSNTQIRAFMRTYMERVGLADFVVQEDQALANAAAQQRRNEL